MARSEAAISILWFDDASMAHLAVVPDDSGFTIEEYSVRRVEGPLDAPALRDFAEYCGVAHQSLYTVVPRHQATVRILTLPSQDPGEIAAMVALGAEEFAPYPREQLIITHHVLSLLPSGNARVFVALIHKDVIEQHAALLTAAGLDPRQIYLSTACIHAAIAAAPRAPADRYAMIQVEESSLEILVMDNGVLQFSRGIAHHAPWDLGDSQSRDTLGYEVRDALAAFRRESEDGQGVELLYVASERGSGAQLAALLQELVGKPCHEATFVHENLAPGNPDGRGIPLAGLGAALAVMGRATLALEFLPPSVTRLRAMRGLQQRLRRAAFLVGVVLAAVLVWFGQAVVQRVWLIGELRSQLDALAPGAQGVAAMQKGLQTIARQVDRGGNVLELLSAVATAAPPADFNITRIEYDRETGMNVWGRARSKDLVLGEFLGNLRRMGEGSLAQLALAHSQYETAGQERDQSIVNYQVSIPALPEEGPDESPSPDR